jgi:hypothetical protein
VLDAALPVAFERTSPGRAYKIAIEADRHADASRFADALSGEERAVAEDAIDAWFGDETSFHELADLALANPLNESYVNLCLRVASRTHESGWTHGWRGECFSGHLARIVRVNPPEEAAGGLPGPNAALHFQFVYRRLVPNGPLVPGLAELRNVFAEDALGGQASAISTAGHPGGLR